MISNSKTDPNPKIPDFMHKIEGREISFRCQRQRFPNDEYPEHFRILGYLFDNGLLVMPGDGTPAVWHPNIDDFHPPGLVTVNDYYVTDYRHPFWGAHLIKSFVAYLATTKKPIDQRMIKRFYDLVYEGS
jgi:hypothetical protein